ncbi:hypothetical protein ANCCAN_08184 [Ancylostoma caninum]|uniref:MADF domain-containing protein n=1 Tax=Ancylostoma caninum TaxID=29170 RepID=A0A368GS29_ANCCA|nr:hypothetical protein ANCCAN_08184 [Ancylostoma caninum]
MKRNPDAPVGPALSDAEKHSLIPILTQTAVLWNEEDPSYKDNHSRQETWRQVYAEMEAVFRKTAHLQKTFENIRDTFVRKRWELAMFNARSPKKSPGGRKRITSWPFYEELMFLAPVASTGVRYTNVVDTEAYEEAEENISSGCVMYSFTYCSPIILKSTSRSTTLSKIQLDAVQL